MNNAQVQVKSPAIANQAAIADQGIAVPQEKVRVHAPVQIEESIKTLIQNINTELHDRKCRIVQFISSRAGEGTSRIIRKMARVLASHYHRRVLLLDTDRKNPTHASAFNVKTRFSWDNTVMEGASSVEAYVTVDHSPLCIGQLMPNHSPSLQVLSEDQLRDFFDGLRNEFDYILVDSAPLNRSLEALVLSRPVDGVVLIVEAESTRSEVADKSVEMIRKHGGDILGVVLNKRKYPIPNYIYRWL
jgi:protein-tyrosine kinase